MRTAAVMAGLVVAGVVFGTIAATLVLVTWRVRELGLGSIFDRLPMVTVFFALFFGGGLGAVLGPLAAWTLMRRVPLWLMLSGPTAGTFVGGGVMVLVTNHPLFVLLGGAVGCLMAAAELYSRYEDEPERERLKPPLGPP